MEQRSSFSTSFLAAVASQRTPACTRMYVPIPVSHPMQADPARFTLHALQKLVAEMLVQANGGTGGVHS